MKPQTFMNLSGRSVSSACRAHGIAGHSLVVVHDDTDLALGRIKVRLGGGSAGHRGVGSIAEETGDPGFVRIKLGVGRPTEGDDLSDFVLSPFDQGESEVVADMVERGAEAVSSVVAEGVEVAMRRFNGVVTNVNEK
jgi:PTH1 family peptidyl-tRNA hydrolase